MKRIIGIIAWTATAVLLLTARGASAQKKRLHTVPCRNYAQVEAYFRYTPGCGTIVSGHRGGMAPGYPENCIETFENTLSHMPSFFEIDPQMTRDSVIVLMHDPTIDRTTTGKGKVSDYTYEELQRFNLVDRQGTVTPYKIPRVSDVIRWSRGKTILNFDKKEVPRDVLIRLVNELKAKNVIYTVHSADDARTCYGLDPDAHFSAWIGDMRQFREYEATGIPWSRFIAFVVSGTMKPEQRELYDALHAKGVRCMISVAPTVDRLPEAEKRKEGYRTEIAKNPDIIETDYPLELIGLY